MIFVVVWFDFNLMTDKFGFKIYKQEIFQSSNFEILEIVFGGESKEFILKNSIVQKCIEQRWGLSKWAPCWLYYHLEVFYVLFGWYFIPL